MVPLCQRKIVLNPGRHRFNLRVNIPETAPSSLESQFGSIRYTIRLQMVGNAEHVSLLYFYQVCKINLFFKLRFVKYK